MAAPKVPATPEERRLRKELKKLSDVVSQVLAGIDVVMKGPACPDRARCVAELANTLDFANDEARHFGLGVSLRGLKRKLVVMDVTGYKKALLEAAERRKRDRARLLGGAL